MSEINWSNLIKSKYSRTVYENPVFIYYVIL